MLGPLRKRLELPYLFFTTFVMYSSITQSIGIAYPIYDDTPGWETRRL